ncbi:MAG: DUF3021 domain-containing protein [Lachnospiraceae bacterium]|nr:DUF3021 domain-containing protein [Lachnospiraceae bacterium]
MNKTKLIFNQTLMISTAILFGMGVRNAILFLTAGQDMVNWQWYVPLSIVVVGFFCSLASLLLYDDSALSSAGMRIRLCIHCLLVLGIVSLFGYLFGWYSDLSGYMLIVIMYIIIYAFVWLSTLWMLKADEKKINEAIEDIRDEE